MKYKYFILQLFMLVPSMHLYAEKLSENLVLYGIVKPKFISTQIAIGQGIINKISVTLGDEVKKGTQLVRVFERDQIRTYRSSITGKVAKVHVTGGAVATSGRPLITIVDDKKKYLEFSLSPHMAHRIEKGQIVTKKSNQKPIGAISKVAPIVDPDDGSVKAFSSLNDESSWIGQVIPVSITTKESNCNEIITLQDLSSYQGKGKVKFVSGSKVCLE